MNVSHWFKDAVIYELHVRSFQDSNADGIGDFRGLLQRLGYLADLGVTAIWLLPFYPSPLRDDGYDIADYYSVNPSYGTLTDFQEFLAEAHRRGLRVITELVLNHTSDQNPWFQRARRAPAGSPERDFYVWSDDPRKYSEARIIFKDFETSNWTWDPLAKAYFWHRFYSHQPDLNFDNPRVHEELIRVIDFWLGLGVDGLRLDAVPYLYEREGTNCENLPETHAFLRKIRHHMDARFPGRMLLAEANQWPEDAAAYFGNGDECNMEFHFPLMPRMFMGLQMEDRFPIIDILEQTPAIPDSCQWAIFLRNHDELTLEMVTDEERDYMVRMYAEDTRARINLGIRRRLAPLLQNNRRKIELINALLFSLPGTPIIYYGDEIGMGDNFYLGDRNGVRTPMQWSPDRNAGFSSANPQQLFLPAIIDPEYHYEAINAENQQRNQSSLFWWMRRLIAMRQRYPAFARGSIEFLQPANAKVLVFLRRYQSETMLVIANLSRFSQAVEIDLSSFVGATAQECFSRGGFIEIKAGPTQFTLGPHGFYWLALHPTSEAGGAIESVTPSVAFESRWGVELRRVAERELLPPYLARCRWFQGTGRQVREIHVVSEVTIPGSDVHVWVIEVTFREGSPDTYFLPLALIQGDTAARISTESSAAVLARLPDGELLCDALFLAEFRQQLLLSLTGRAGDQIFSGKDVSAHLMAAMEGGLPSRILPEEGSNTLISYADAFLLKFVRRLDTEFHPESAVLRVLQAHGFEQSPRFHGELRFSLAGRSEVIGVVTEFVQNQGDGWNYTLDALSRYFDRVLEVRNDLGNANPTDLIGGIYTERARQLGQATARMHLALAAESDDPAFAPEAFSTLYQRSRYQAMRGSVGRLLRELRQCESRLTVETGALIKQAIDSHAEIVAIFARIVRQRLSGQKVRGHGDLHLGQTLNTGKDFVIIDFEGDACRPVGERVLKRSPLVDVAAMVRSFDYAAAVALSKELESDMETLRPWADRWVSAVADHYLRAYLAEVAGKGLIPEDPAEVGVLLGAFVLDRAIGEVRHDLEHRSSYLPLSLRALLRILENDRRAVAGAGLPG